jgi:hypothetical protein
MQTFLQKRMNQGNALCRNLVADFWNVSAHHHGSWTWAMLAAARKVDFTRAGSTEPTYEYCGKLSTCTMEGNLARKVCGLCFVQSVRSYARTGNASTTTL